MIGIALCILGFIAAVIGARKSIGYGLVVVMSLGYLYGYVRATDVTGATHFVFDATLAGFYVGHFTQPVDPLTDVSTTAKKWFLALIGWPIVCMAYSPIFEESQPLLVQLVGLRASVLAVPCIIVGARVKRSDFDTLAPWLALLNLVAFAFAVVEYVYGLESIMPRNQNTELMYASHDILAGGEYYTRIPSCFVTAHVYGGTMVTTMPFIAHGLESQTRSRLLCMAGMGAAGVGAFLCGARLPVVILIVATSYVLLLMRARWATLFAVVAGAGAVAYVVMHSERLQRFETLGDTDLVADRLNSSLNSTFFDMLQEHPLGLGLASAFGTSIPYFLQDIAKPQFGMESEYGRILLEEGIVGLAIWLAFAGATMFRRNKQALEAAKMTHAYSYILVCAGWVSATIGSGLTVAVPTSVLFLIMAGMRVVDQPVEVHALGLRHVNRAPHRRAIGMRALPAAAKLNPTAGE